MSIRIGCHSAFWGDSPTAAYQLVHQGGTLHYLVSDYLAEVTMGILARSRTEPARGNAGDGGFIAEFAKTVWKPLMKEIISRKIKVVTNAGGMNPEGLKAAIEQLTKEAGLPVPMVAAVTGDDITAQGEQLRKDGSLKPFVMEGEAEKIGKEGVPFMSLNAYLGAFPIARALARGAQVVITGRCVDSALTLGPLIHEFGWQATDYDLLSSGSLAGHIIECGCQATGGNYTDWEESYKAGWVNVGFPIVECERDGSFVVTKPPNTGGIVTRATVAEQMLYEIGDPAAYMLPDVTCDWRSVHIEQEQSKAGKPSNRVRVSGAKGRPPSNFYKVSGTYFDGYKISGELLVGGRDAARKAQAVGESVLAKASFILARRGMQPFTATNIELLGAEHIFGPHSQARNAREVVLRLGAVHNEPMALLLLASEVAPSATSMAPGITGGGSGRPRPTPLINHFACLIEKNRVPMTLVIGSEKETLPPPTPTLLIAAPALSPIPAPPSAAASASGQTVLLPLLDLCYGRSGDKGDMANIGLFVREPRFYPLLSQLVTAEAVGKHLAHLTQGKVSRYELPGIHGWNFLLTHALGGGGLVSLNIDRQGKTYAQQLLEMRVPVPVEWVAAKSRL